MSASLGPDIVRNGLVFCVDPGDGKSLVGEPTTNILQFPEANWNGSTFPLTYDYDATATNTRSYVLGVENPVNSPGILRYTTGTNGYKYWALRGTVPSAGTYTFSYYARISSGSNSNLSNAQIWRDSTGDKAVTGDWNPTITTEWQRYTTTGPVTSFLDYFPIHSGALSAGITVDYCGFQLEAKSYATPFVNGTRNTIKDISGLNNIGTLSNIPLFNVSQNGSLLFNASSSQQIVFQNTSALQFLNTANYTLESWVYPTANPGANNWTGILDRESNIGAGRDGYNLYMNGSAAPGTDVYFGCDRWCSGTGVFPSITVSNSDALNKWQLLTYTYDGTNVRLYRNGILGATATSTGNITNNSKALTMGVRGGQFFTGRISNTKIYNRALSATEVKKNFDNLRIRFGV